MDTKRHKRTHPDQMDRKILEIALTNPSMTDEEIGQEVGLSRSAVAKRKAKGPFQNLLIESTQNSQQILKSLSNKAASELGKLLEDLDPRIRLAAATSILKLAPQIPPDAYERRTVLIDLTWADEIEK